MQMWVKAVKIVNTEDSTDCQVHIEINTSVIKAEKSSLRDMMTPDKLCLVYLVFQILLSHSTEKEWPANCHKRYDR